jgi:hypothetical protein
MPLMLLTPAVAGRPGRGELRWQNPDLPSDERKKKPVAQESVMASIVSAANIGDNSSDRTREVV